MKIFRSVIGLGTKLTPIAKLEEITSSMEVILEELAEIAKKTKSKKIIDSVQKIQKAVDKVDTLLEKILGKR